MSQTETSPPPAADRTSTDQATKVFSQSVLISATRCALTYVVFPWLLPLVGLTTGAGSVIGLVAGLAAIGFNVLSIRRMHASDFRFKWPISIINAGVIVLLLILVGLDIADLT